MSLLAWIILVVIVIAALVVLAAVFYVRATNEVSLVKTGVGGRKVIADGGTIALPYFHEISRVNMQTIRMSVDCRGEASLITQDRLRVDVGAEVYVSVKPEADAISRASQTLGKRLFQPEQLKGLLDGMVIDALRSEAAKLTLDALHENRSAFVANVQAALADPLSRYGLEMDSVSLIALDQTPFSELDENNAFNAVGMRKLAEVIATSRKERAEIESNSDVSVSQATMEAEKRKLEIALEQRRAEIAQAQEIETLLAAQLAEVARTKAASEREKAHARIEMEQAIQAEEIASRQALDLAERDRQIQIAAKSQEESKAQAEADMARTEAVKAADALRTAEAMAEAERHKALVLLQAEQDAEAAATKARIAAASEKATAADRRAAMEEEAAAMKTAEQARAEAALARIEAENARSDAIIAMELEKARLEALPGIISEMVKPAEKITGISINQISGLGGDGGSGDKAPVSQAIDAILGMAVQLPALQKIGDAVGVNIDDSLTELKKAGKKD